MTIASLLRSSHFTLFTFLLQFFTFGTRLVFCNNEPSWIRMVTLPSVHMCVTLTSESCVLIGNRPHVYAWQSIHIVYSYTC